MNSVTNLCNFVGKMVCVCGCVWVYVELLSNFPPFKIHLTNVSPILIKMVDFKNLAWATSFATWASRKFIYGKKSYCHTLRVCVCRCVCVCVFMSACVGVCVFVCIYMSVYACVLVVCVCMYLCVCLQCVCVCVCVCVYVCMHECNCFCVCACTQFCCWCDLNEYNPNTHTLTLGVW